MAVNKQIKLHELVVSTDPLPVWYFIFHDAQFNSYVAPHWHRDIELSFTLNGSISNFRIGKRDYTTKAGQILVVNTQVIHCVDSPKNNINKSISIIFPFDYVENFYPNISHQEIDIQ